MARVEILKRSKLAQALTLVSQQPSAWNAIKAIRSTYEQAANHIQHELATSLIGVAKSLEVRVKLNDALLDHVVTYAELRNKRVYVAAESEYWEQELRTRTVFNYEWRFNIKMRPAYVIIDGKTIAVRDDIFNLSRLPPQPAASYFSQGVPSVEIKKEIYQVKEFGYSFTSYDLPPNLSHVVKQILLHLQRAAEQGKTHEIIGKAGSE